MHSSSFTDPNGREWLIHHNGDFSGDAEITPPGAERYAIAIPNEILFAYVAEAIRAERIRELEQAEPGALLGGGLGPGMVLAERSSMLYGDEQEPHGMITEEARARIAELELDLLGEFRGRAVVFRPTVNKAAVSRRQLEAWFAARGVRVRICGIASGGTLIFSSASLILRTGAERG